MKEIKYANTHRRHTFIPILLIMLAFVILVSSAGAVPYAYITNGGSNTVSVIDTSTNTVTATVPVGSVPIGVAVNPAGTKVYVTNCLSNNVSVIDTATNMVTATVNVELEPFGIAVNPAGTKVYVTNTANNTVSVIDTTTNTVTDTVNVGYYPTGIAVSPDGTKVYVANCVSNDVSVIDTATNMVTATVNAGTYPSGIAVSPDGTKVYVTNTVSNNVSVIDTATNTVTAKVKIAQSGANGIVVAPDGTKVYVANQYGNTTSVIDTATNNVIATVYIGYTPYGIAVTPDGTKVYVASGSDNSVSVIDTATNMVTAIVNVGYSPIAFGRFIGSLPAKPVLPVDTPSSSPTTGNDQIPADTAIPVATFSTPTTGNAPLTVAFTDKSADTATSWEWSFGDGTYSTDKEPVHTFSKAGRYIVSLTVANAAGSNTVTKSSYVFVNGLKAPVASDLEAPVASDLKAPVAAFSASLISGKAPLTVSFTDKSTGSPATYLWNFGDKSTSTARNPVHKYSKAGKYTVSLTVKNTKGSNTKKMSNYITVKSK